MADPTTAAPEYPFVIPASLAAKVGSIVAHVDEALSDDGHAFDVTTLRALVNLPDVREWVDALSKLALVSVKR